MGELDAFFCPLEKGVTRRFGDKRPRNTATCDLSRAPQKKSRAIQVATVSTKLPLTHAERLATDEATTTTFQAPGRVVQLNRASTFWPWLALDAQAASC
jgi:hypothetical protein